tara:strand:+ start:1426 stop:1668 length:243 start_codon:yes stop_codon:yes gene_type:complete
MSDEFKKLQSKNLTAMQRHDVYEVTEVEEITDEFDLVMGELKEEYDLKTEEVNATIQRKEKKTLMTNIKNKFKSKIKKNT